MIEFFMAGGPYMWLILGLSIVIALLVIRKAIDLFVRTDLTPERLERGLNAILFWGCISAVLGVLGQFQGYYLSLRVVASAPVISPKMLAEGMAQATITTLFGLAQLFFAALAWFGLCCRYRSLAARLKQ
jgi:biopolymer transport protein ExbB/TolQ